MSMPKERQVAPRIVKFLELNSSSQFSAHDIARYTDSKTPTVVNIITELRAVGCVGASKRDGTRAPLYHILDSSKLEDFFIEREARATARAIQSVQTKHQLDLNEPWSGEPFDPKPFTAQIRKPEPYTLETLVLAAELLVKKFFATIRKTFSASPA
jgi:hypothetical protein